MTMINTWCLCDDDIWYKNPVWGGENWFVMLNPVVLVVEWGTIVPELPWLELDADGFRRAKSCFAEEFADMRDSVIYSAKLIKAPPRPDVSYEDSSHISPNSSGVAYIGGST